MDCIIAISIGAAFGIGVAVASYKLKISFYAAFALYFAGVIQQSILSELLK